eukprot:7477530-Pyramimonas_sp.AAC.1
MFDVLESVGATVSLTDGSAVVDASQVREEESLLNCKPTLQEGGRVSVSTVASWISSLHNLTLQWVSAAGLARYTVDERKA